MAGKTRRSATEFDRRVAVAVPLVLAAACGDAAQAPPVMETDSAGISIVTSDPLQSDAVCSLSDEPTFLVGDNQDDESQWFSSVSGVGGLSDGSVVVAERGSGQLRIYDRTGQHLRSMGRLGEGPGEFSRLWFLRVLPGDTVWVGDYRPMRYFVYSSGGDWVRTIDLDPIYPNPTRDGGVLANRVSINVRNEEAERQDFRSPDTWHVEAHAPDGELVGPVATVTARTFGKVKEDPTFLIDPIFDPSASVDARGHTIAIANGLDPEVRVLDEELRLRLIVRWHDPGRQVTGEHVRAAKDAIEEWARRDGELSASDRARLSPDRPAADVLPAVRRVWVGTDGSIWVFPEGIPGEAEPPRPMGFGADGRFLCHVENVPDGYGIWEVGADYVLGILEREFDVQLVAKYDLTRPGALPD